MISEGAYVMCRTCLSYSFPFSNVFKELLGEGYVYEVLMDVCQLEVSSDDGLPEYVCFDCHQNISKFHSFKLQTQESNAALHRLKIKHKITIEPVSCFTSSTPNNGSSLKSTTRTLKECYVRLSRCDQLLQEGHSPKVNIKKEKEDPAYLDNESGNIQGADMQLPVTLVGERDSPSASKGSNKEKLREEALQANTQGVVKLNEVLCSENLFSNGKEFEGDDIEIHEEKPYSEYASLTCFSSHLHFTNKTAKGVGNLTIRDGDHPFDEAYIEAEPQEITETSENGCVATDSNLQHCEDDPEEIISRLLERNAHPGVELYLDQSNDEKSLDNGRFKIRERELLEEMQFECGIFESRNHEYSSSEGIDKRCLMRESCKETVKSDNVVSKTYREKSKFLGDLHIQHRKVNSRDLHDIVVCDHCRKEFQEKSDLLKHLVRIKREYTCKSPLKIHECMCKWCGKKFAYASELKTHERVHTGEKPFSCKYCSRKFSLKGNLSKHELIHAGVKPFSCSFCSKSFSQKYILKRHKLTHLGVTPFSCSYCSKGFYRKGDLNRHELIHTGVRPFSCKFCSKKFNVKSNLTKHELIHTGDKPYMCKYCSKRFRLEAHLKLHEQIHTIVLSCG